jgi:hypothetical protein
MFKKKKSFAIVVLLGAVLTSCATQYYAFDGDYNGKTGDVELSEEESALRDYLFDQARVVESFSDSTLETGFERVGTIGELTTGEYLIRHESSQGLEALRYHSDQEFTSVTVCWDLESSRGHLIIWATIPDFGRPTFFNNPGATSAHIHLDSLDGDTEFLGHNEDNRRGYLIQEVRVEHDEIVLLVNGTEFKRYPMDRERTISGFQIGANDGGAGAIDWIAVR